MKVPVKRYLSIFIHFYPIRQSQPNLPICAMRRQVSDQISRLCLSQFSTGKKSPILILVCRTHNGYFPVFLIVIYISTVWHRVCIIPVRR
jgi:hypothetical protein